MNLQRRLEDAQQQGYVTGFEHGRRVGPRRPRAVLVAFMLGLIIGALQRLL